MSRNFQDENKDVEMIDLESNNNNSKEYQSLPRRNSDDGTKLEWHGITYVVPGTVNTANPNGSTNSMKISSEKIIINNISGSALPGELLAIMGTSGAGKSTLLDILAGRLDSKGLSGHLHVNGATIDKKKFRKESGYVMQSDALFPLLTVRETFRFAAYLRIANKTTEEKHEIAEKTIKLLRLESCADTTVGNDQIRGISGGEKRRVSIGVDITHEPKVIFLDEPTSGLDSSTAYAVVDSLRQLAHVKGCTLVMTLHQPSAKLFGLIDKVMFLSKGVITYSGRASDLQAFTSNIYDELKLVNASVGNASEAWLDLCDQLIATNDLDKVTSKFANDSKDRPFPLLTEASSGLVKMDEVNTVDYANTLVGDILVLCRRSLMNILRTKELFAARMGSTLFFAVLLGTLFLYPDNNEKGIGQKAAYFILTLAYFYWTSLEALPIFYQEKEIFEREYSSGAYRAASYTLSAILVYTPFFFALSFVYTVISWWLLGLPNVAELFLFQVFVVFVVLILGSSFATLLSVFAPDPMTGQTIGSAILSTMLVFSGFFIPRADIPDYWIYFHYLSLFKYAIDSELVNGLKDHMTTATLTNSQVLGLYSLQDMNKWQGVGILIGWIIFFRFLFYYRLTTAFDGRRK